MSTVVNSYFVICLCFSCVYKLHLGFKQILNFSIVCYISGIAGVIGIAFWGGFSGNSLVVFAPTVGCSGALLEILAAIFGVLDIVGVKG